MIVLNDHQSRLWHRMLLLIDEFLQGRLGYYEFVGALEGALDAGEFRDKGLVENWYEYWTPLESVRAQGNDVNIEDVRTDVVGMKEYLESVLASNDGR